MHRTSRIICTTGGELTPSGTGRFLARIYWWLPLICLAAAHSLVTASVDTIRFRADATTVSLVGEGFIKTYRGNVKMWDERRKMTADEATYDHVRGVALLSGSVRLLEEGRTLSADRIVYWPDGDSVGGSSDPLAKLFGHVTLEDSGRTLVADSLTYWPSAKRGVAGGNVVLSGDGRVISADRITYDDSVKTMTALGSVVMSDSGESVSVSGQLLRYNRRSGEAVITEKPVLIQDGADGTITVSGDTMRLAGADSSWRVTVVGSATIAGGGLFATCDSLFLDQTQNRIWLYGRPHAEHSSEGRDGGTRSDVDGDEMEIVLSDSMTIESLTVSGSAEGRSVDTDMSGITVVDGWVKGRQIVFRLAGDTMTGITVVGSARSRYRASAEDEVNEATGDTINVSFADGQMSRVVVTGGVQGLYRMIQAASEAASEYDEG